MRGRMTMKATVSPPAEPEVTFELTLTLPESQVNEWVDQCRLATELANAFGRAIDSHPGSDPYDALEAARS